MRFLLTDQNIFDLLIYNRQLQKQPKARQMQYSQMISLLANNFILDDSPELKEVGRGCLYALCYEVIYQHRIKILNKDFIPMVLSIMKAQLKVNSEDQLLLFLGAKIFMTEQNQNEKRIVRQTLFDIINRYNHPQIPSFSKKIEYQQDSFEQDYEYNQHEQKKYTPRQIICQNNQNVFAVQGSFMQAYFPRILAQMKGKIDPQKEKILNYLASIKIPKTLLSQFCQFCKNELKQNPIYNLNKQGQMYHVDAVLIFDNRYTSFVPRKYEYSAKFANLNRAQNHAALGLLQQAFIDYPQSLTQFTNKKSKMI